MAEDTKQPDTDASKPADVSDQSTAGEAQAAVTADSEKNSKVEDAKARVAAAKEALTEKAAAVPTTGAPAAPKAPVKKKEEGPKPVDASAHPNEAKRRLARVSVNVFASAQADGLLVQYLGDEKGHGQEP